VIVSYRHEDGTVEEVSTEDLSAVESAAIESVTGQEWGDVEGALRTQSPTTMRAVLWAFRKRKQPTLRFSEFDVAGWRRRLKARLEYEEILDLVEGLRRENSSEEHFDEMLHHMRSLAHDADDVDKAVTETAPKEAALQPAPDPAESASSSTPTGL
jgi:hypothetical protein